MVVVRRLTDRALDPIIAFAVIAFCLVVTTAIAQDSTDPFNGWTVALIVLIGGTLAFRRRAPEAALAVSVAGLTIYSVQHYAGGPIYLVPLVLVATIGAEGDRRRTIYCRGRHDPRLRRGRLRHERRGPHPLSARDGRLADRRRVPRDGVLQPSGAAVPAPTAGQGSRGEPEEEARRRVAEERLRIARDLHDVIAHGIATIHLQAGAALYVLERQPDVAAPALATIKELSKQTLDELRATVGVLRSDAADGEAPLAPTPGIRQLDDLVEQARHAGLSVDSAGRPEPRRCAGSRRRRRVPDRAGVAHQRDAPRRTARRTPSS